MAFMNLAKKPAEAVPVEEALNFLGDNPALAPRKERHAFSDFLLSRGLVSKEEIAAALMEQKVTKERVGAILVRNGFLTQDVLIPAILEFDAERIATERVNSSRVPVDILEKMNIIVSAETDDTIYVATMSDEDEVGILIRSHYPDKVIKFVAFLPENLPDFLDRMRRTDSMGLSETDGEMQAEEMLERLLYSAMKLGASDIHVEPRGHSYSVFFRLLGERRLMHEGALDEYNTIAAQLKDRSRMDLAERRINQDGGFQMEHAGRFVDLRVATVPSVEGEQVIIRVLDPERVNPKLADLGISRITHWRRAMTRQNGLCLICGPTGSGKTTTLNASIREMARFEKKIYTVEDPTEYRIPFVGQVSVNHQVGLDFARAVRGFMRADPDVIVLGEVRDAETAKNAIKAADTGHLVLATLHTGSIQSSVSRLRDLGVDGHELRYILRGVLVQTLVRVICKPCSGTGVVHDATCPACGGIGYGSRSVVSECVSFDGPDDVDRVIAMTEPGVRAAGVMPWPEMIDDAIDRMVAGLTSMDELRRVFGTLAEDRVAKRGIDAEAHTLRPSGRT